MVGLQLPGTILRAQSPARFTVSLQDGRTLDRHIDHIRSQLETEQVEPVQGSEIPASDLLEDEDEAPSPDGPPVNPVEQPQEAHVRDLLRNYGWRSCGIPNSHCVIYSACAIVFSFRLCVCV